MRRMITDKQIKQIQENAEKLDKINYVEGYEDSENDKQIVNLADSVYIVNDDGIPYINGNENGELYINNGYAGNAEDSDTYILLNQDGIYWTGELNSEAVFNDDATFNQKIIVNEIDGILELKPIEKNIGLTDADCENWLCDSKVYHLGNGNSEYFPPAFDTDGKPIFKYKTKNDNRWVPYFLIKGNEIGMSVADFNDWAPTSLYFYDLGIDDYATCENIKQIKIQSLNGNSLTYLYDGLGEHTFSLSGSFTPLTGSEIRAIEIDPNDKHKVMYWEV